MQFQIVKWLLFNRSDTESAEDNSAAGADKETTAPTGEPAQPSEDTTDSVRDEQPAKPKGPTVAAKFSNIFATFKKSVASKGSNTKDKYATPEQVEAEAKVRYFFRDCLYRVYQRFMQYLIVMYDHIKFSITSLIKMICIITPN